jgi:hypothetical protein
MRKRELPLAAIDREWPHQVAVPAKTSLGGLQDRSRFALSCRFVLEVIRGAVRIASSGMSSVSERGSTGEIQEEI